MGKSNRSKKELERALIEYAKQIAALNEFYDIPQNTKLEDKIKLHTSLWNSILREACSDMFYFAKTLSYDIELYNELDATNASCESLAGKLVSNYGEVVLAVAHRRFSSNELSKGDSFIENEFIKKVETDLKQSIKNSAYKEKEEEQRQGISGISEGSLELAKAYFKFKEAYLGFKGKNRPEIEIQEMFVKSHCKSEKHLKKLKQAIIATGTNVLKDCDIVTEDEDGNQVLLFEKISDKVEKEKSEIKSRKRYLRENEVRFEGLCCKLEEFFEKKQKSKYAEDVTYINYWSALITYFLLQNIDSKTVNEQRLDFIIQDLQRRSFFYKELMDYFLKNGTVPTRKSIMEKLGKDEGKASSDTSKIIECLKDFIKRG